MSWISLVPRQRLCAMAILIVRQIHLLIRNSTHSSVPSARAILSSAGSFNRKTLSRQDGSRHLDQSLVILANVMNMGTEAVAEHAAPVVPSFMQKSSDDAAKTYNPPELDNVLFVEAGWGADQHGQNVTKAAVRACRNAIEFNSIPSIRRLVPGGYNNLRLKVKIGVPHPEDVDVEEVRKVFPYGQAFFEVVEGGLSCSSGIAIESLGDKSDEMVIAVAAVTVGYNEDALPPPVQGYVGDGS